MKKKTKLQKKKLFPEYDQICKQIAQQVKDLREKQLITKLKNIAKKENCLGRFA